MAQDGFMPFSRSLNPFRTLERQIDSMFDDSFGAGAAGALAHNQPAAGSARADAQPSLFLRVVQMNPKPRMP